MEPYSYIDPSIVPGFNGQLTDKTKVFGFAWQTALPLLVDPMKKYTIIDKVVIRPRLASQFFRHHRSSDQYLNSTQVFSIIENADKETVGNVTVTIQLAAFNHN